MNALWRAAATTVSDAVAPSGGGTAVPHKRQRSRTRRRRRHVLLECMYPSNAGAGGASKRASKEATTTSPITPTAPAPVAPVRPLAAYAEEWGGDELSGVELDGDGELGELAEREAVDELAALDAADLAHASTWTAARATRDDTPFEVARDLRAQWVTDARAHNTLLGDFCGKSPPPDLRICFARARPR